MGIFRLGIFRQNSLELEIFYVDHRFAYAMKPFHNSPDQACLIDRKSSFPETFAQPFHNRLKG